VDIHVIEGVGSVGRVSLSVFESVSGSASSGVLCVILEVELRLVLQVCLRARGLSKGWWYRFEASTWPHH